MKGDCKALYCFDIAWATDLRRAGETLTASRRTGFLHKSHAPTGEGLARHLRLSWKAEEQDLGGSRTEAEVEIALFDHGALCITWTIPWEGPLESLVALSTALYGNEALIARSREIAGEVARLIRDALDRPGIAALVEDYAVFRVRSESGDDAARLLEERSSLARVLRAEEGELSDQEIEDALAGRISYGPNDVCFVDWLAAILVGGDTEDERMVLEIATVELLSLRLLDTRLVEETNEAYALLARPRGPLHALMHQRRELEHVARTQADEALLHEGIDNALKLFGDDYLARLYRSASARFHFDDWDASIRHKLEVLRDIYQSLATNAAHRRSEILEWIIIALIAIDIVLYFTPLR